jgi:cysteinyl-tRNA synthetase
MVGDQKMSKSLNNFTSLTDLTEKTDPRSYRLLVLRSHYRSPIEVSTATIADAVRGLERLDGLARRFELPLLAGDTLERAASFDLGAAGRDLLDRVATVMANDMDSPAALALLFDAVTSAHGAADRGEQAMGQDLAMAVAVVLAGLGLGLHGAGDQIDEETADLVTARDAARATKDWAEADRLRDQLVSLGWTVEDSASGTVVRH